MTRRHAALLLFALVAAACAAGDRDVELRQVVVHNPTRSEVRLHPVVRDGFGRPRELGSGRTIALQLRPGRYALSIGAQPPRFALPLPAAELGYEPPAVAEVTVRPAPEEQDDWRWIPPGPALRGDRLGVGQQDERPLSTPASAGFWLAHHETTNAEYVRFLNAVGGDRVCEDWLDLDGAKCRVERAAGDRSFRTDAPRMPVVTVSWSGAVAYCDWLTATTGVRHRLPTEAEWEKAARGPGSRVYAYGDTSCSTAANQESGRLREAGCSEPNGYGLVDMTGNAFEWCADAYARGAYQGQRAPGAAGGFRVLRGGSYVLDSIFCRNAMRMRLRPGVRADDVGFRVLREASAESL